LNAIQEPQVQETTATPASLNLAKVLQKMLAVSEKVSDLIFSPGRPPQVELLGKLQAVRVAGLEKLTPAHTAGIAKIIISSHLRAGQDVAVARNLEQHGSTDVSYSAAGLARFRVNIFMQRGTHAIVMRVIPHRPPRFEELNLPEQLKTIVELKNGIVLVTGPTGSGKSSTLAAVIDLINEAKYYHVVTIEDPIEFLHSHKNSTIHQRELYADTSNFPLALRAALRQAPKVILVGEMRDRDTMEVALEAAETGHLVLSTLHTIDASKTVERIIGVFPKNEEQIIRTRLAQSFRYIISQRLLPRTDGTGRIAAIEILKATSRTREYIEHGESEGKSLIDAMEQGSTEGMQTFDSQLEQMIRSGVVTKDDGLAYASNAGNLLLRLGEYGGSLAPPKSEPKPKDKSILDMIER